MEKKKALPLDQKLKRLSKFVTVWRLVGVLFWLSITSLAVLNNRIILSLVLRLGPLACAVLTFLVLRRVLHFTWAPLAAFVVAGLVYRQGAYAMPESTTYSSVWSLALVLVQGLHVLALHFVFSVSHSHQTLLAYLPVACTNLLIGLVVFTHEDPSRVYHSFLISALNAVVLTLWSVYNEDYVYIFPLQQKKRLYEMLDVLPHTCMSALVWAVINLLLLALVYFGIWMTWKEFDVTLPFLQTMFYSSALSYFLIKSSSLIYNIILSERVNFNKLERDLRLLGKDEAPCETMFAAMKSPSSASSSPTVTPTPSSATLASSSGANAAPTVTSGALVPPLVRCQAWRDLHRLAHFEPDEWHALFFRDAASWERVSVACLDEIQTFTRRMERYCTSKRPQSDFQATFGEEFFFSSKSIIRGIQERREQERLFADYEVLTLAVKIIAKLTVESKTADVSGILQLHNQHQLIVETLNRAYTALDAYFRLKKKRINYQKSKSLSQEIKQATYMITTAFYKHLGTLSFATRDTLQPFIDFVA